MEKNQHFQIPIRSEIRGPQVFLIIYLFKEKLSPECLKCLICV